MRSYYSLWVVFVLGVTCASIRGEETPADWWALRKPVRPEVPAVEQDDRVRNPIDAFVFAKLAGAGLSPAPPADRYTLVRRASFDLIGLPPTPEQVEKFVTDESPDAWPRLVDELLESPHYGERWGRHWLDVARYADSGGFEGDMSYPNAWRYRDYVVRSFNRDTPYNVFVQEQVAGDEIWPDNLELDPKRVYQLPDAKLRHLEARLGTGLYGFGPRVLESALDARRYHLETLTDWVDTTSSVFLGLTIGCARCHDHKFDPITQEDYYAMQAIFTSSVETEVPVVSAMEVASWYHPYPRTVALEEARIAYKVFRERTAGRELTAEEQAEQERLRDTIVQKVMELPEKGISVPNTQLDPLMQIPVATVLGHERPELVKPVYFLERGELYEPRQRMAPALPGALARATGREKEVPGPFGSRKELALWLSHPDHPLTARVMVNRIWLWHFGQGLVATPNDFGRNGVAPSHSGLLDWLAATFVDRGWSIKEMHRLIMTSGTYRMSSRFGTAAHQRIDPDNHLLWRMNRRRLEAEALWDAVHAVAGTINLAIGGRPVVPPLAEDEIAALREKWQWPVSGDPAQHTRRGLYILVLRNFRFPMFEVFDAPVNSVSCPQRDVTTVAPQALWGLNSPSVWRQAEAFAARVAREAGEEPAARVERAWRLALGRHPSGQEEEEALALLETLGAAPTSRETGRLAELCLAIFNLSEFAYVD